MQLQKISNDQSIHVCFAIYDPYNTYSKYLGAAICSLLVNAGSAHVTIHIIHDNTLSEADKKKFDHLVKQYNKSIVFHCIDNSEFQSVSYLVDNYTIGALYRLKIPEIMPVNLDKIIYLDCDLIVHLNIVELWKLNIEDYAIAACIDPYVNANRTLLPTELRNLIEKTEGAQYFNSGVLVMNLKKIRSQGNLFQVSMNFLANNPQCKFPDQDAFNYIFCKQVLFIDKKYNLFSQRIKNTKTDNMPAGIYHICGEPVNFEANRNVDRLFMHYLLLTEWGGGFELYQYMQSWVSHEAKKFYTLKSIIKRLLQDSSLKIILFGANSTLFNPIKNLFPEESFAYFIDNNKNLQGKIVHGLMVHSPTYLEGEHRGSFLVFVLSKKYYDSISLQLIDMGLLENVDFYDARLIMNEVDTGYYNENKERGLVSRGV